MKKTSGILKLFRQINQFAIQDVRIKRFIASVVILTTIIAVFPMGTNYVLAQLMNRLQMIATAKQVQNVTWMTGLYLLLIMVPSALRTIKARLTGKISDYFVQCSNIILKKKIADLDHAYFDDPEFHDMVKNVKEKGVSTTSGMFLLQFDALDLSIGILFSTIAVSFLGLQYSVILAVSTIPMLGIELWKKKQSKKVSDQNRTDYRYANVYADELGSRETRIFGLNQKYLSQYKTITDGILDRFITYADRRAKIDLVGLLFLCLGVAYVMHHTFNAIAAGSILIGSGYFILTAVWAFVSSLIQWIKLVAQLYENIMYSQEYFELLALPAIIKQKEQSIITSSNRGPAIAFENVSFSYPGKEKLALENVTFQITGGSKVSLVGENGGGKSTAIKLLLRFYDPTRGRIIIDGQDLRDLNLETWRNIIGYVAQSPSIPNLKLREVLSHEILLQDDLLLPASNRTRAHEFIKNYKHQYDQQLGKMFKDGISPSDGQRQRLAISRAYSKNPKLLIFDEPTADLDPDTQNHVFTDFYQNNVGVTGILVAHALQGVIAADCIYVFEKGLLTQVGNHEKLISYDNWYQSSFEKQSKPFQSFVH